MSMKNNQLPFIRSRSFWTKTACIVIFPFALYYLYQLGYTIVDKSFRDGNYLNRQTTANHFADYMEIIIPVTIGLFLLILTYFYKKQSK